MRRRSAKMTFEQYLIGREVVVTEQGGCNADFHGVIVAMPDDGGETRLIKFDDDSHAWVHKRNMRLA